MQIVEEDKENMEDMSIQFQGQMPLPPAVLRQRVSWRDVVARDLPRATPAPEPSEPPEPPEPNLVERTTLFPRSPNEETNVLMNRLLTDIISILQHIERKNNVEEKLRDIATLLDIFSFFRERSTTIVEETA